MNIHHFTESDVYDYGLYEIDQILQEAGKKSQIFPLCHLSFIIGIWKLPIS